MKKTLSLICLIALLQGSAGAQFTRKASDNSTVSVLNSSYLTESLSFQENGKTLFDAGPGQDAGFYKKRQKTHFVIGLVLLGTGLVSGVVGILTANSTNYTNNNGNTAATFFVVSAATGIASIPFMAMAMANHHKSKMAMKNEKTGWGMPPGRSRDLYGLSLSLPLSR